MMKNVVEKCYFMRLNCDTILSSNSNFRSRFAVLKMEISQIALSILTVFSVSFIYSISFFFFTFELKAVRLGH